MDIQAEEPEDDFPINKPEKEDTSVSDESEGVTMVFEPTVSNPVPIVQEDSLEEAEPGFEVDRQLRKKNTKDLNSNRIILLRTWKTTVSRLSI
mgnify:CR=1 FL=1